MTEGSCNLTSFEPKSRKKSKFIFFNAYFTCNQISFLIYYMCVYLFVPFLFFLLNLSKTLYSYFDCSISQLLLLLTLFICFFAIHLIYYLYYISTIISSSYYNYYYPSFFYLGLFCHSFSIFFISDMCLINFLSILFVV